MKYHVVLGIHFQIFVLHILISFSVWNMDLSAICFKTMLKSWGNGLRTRPSKISINAILIHRGPCGSVAATTFLQLQITKNHRKMSCSLDAQSVFGKYARLFSEIPPRYSLVCSVNGRELYHCLVTDWNRIGDKNQQWMSIPNDTWPREGNVRFVSDPFWIIYPALNWQYINSQKNISQINWFSSEKLLVLLNKVEEVVR